MTSPVVATRARWATTATSPVVATRGSGGGTVATQGWGGRDSCVALSHRPMQTRKTSIRCHEHLGKTGLGYQRPGSDSPYLMAPAFLCMSMYCCTLSLVISGHVMSVSICLAAPVRSLLVVSRILPARS